MLCLSRGKCYYVSGSLSVTYLKTLIQRGNFYTATLSMERNVEALDGSTCRGNSPLYVFLDSDESSQRYLEQVNITTSGNAFIF